MMTQENKDKLLEMIKMRLDGCTYQEIADKYGVSRQCVQQSIVNFAKKEGCVRKTSVDMCIYPNLRMWMEENNMSLSALNRIICKSPQNAGRVGHKIRGEAEFRISEIKAILNASGKTFEYMFSTENEAD